MENISYKKKTNKLFLWLTILIVKKRRIIHQFFCKLDSIELFI